MKTADSSTSTRKPRAAPASLGALDDGLTPAMRQYAEQKAQVPDAILLFRIGDFYEMFNEDARTAARVLNLTLTSRSRDNPIPLAGIPYHALNSYLARLVRAGYKVAISEQMEDARLAKGIVRREVLRVVTPGTLTDETLLDARTANTLIALVPAQQHRAAGTVASVGIACVELASGRFWAELVPVARARDEVIRIRPAEVLLPQLGIDDRDELAESLQAGLKTTFTRRAADRFDPARARELLHEHFGVRTMAGFGFPAMDASLCAAAVILDYLRETQRAALGHVLRIERRQSEQFVTLDGAAVLGLEIDRAIRDGGREGTLYWAVDRTSNPMGARRLRDWLCFPPRDAQRIIARQEMLAALRSERMRLTRIRTCLKEMADIERIVGRLGVGRAGPRDLTALGRSLRSMDAMAEMLNGTTSDPPADATPAPPADAAQAESLAGIAAAMTGWTGLAAYLESALRPEAPPHAKEGGYIAAGFHAELDRLRAIQNDGSRWMAEYQAQEAARLGIPSLKVAYNQVFGYYIEITNAHRAKAPDNYVRRQTVRQAERFITEELKRHEEEVLGAEDRAKQLESELFETIKARALQDLERLQQAASRVADLDAAAGLAELSLERHYCRPQLVTDAAAPILQITDGRHPVLEQVLGNAYVPNDADLGPSAGTLVLLTGPNMAGKSTYIRQAALLTLMAQTGSDVPAASMRWSPVDRIFARIGASDDIARGQSTFMVEMVETAEILNCATRDSLVVLDEIGRGTSTFDGLAIAWAVCEQLVRDLGCRALFATHYHELTELAKLLPGVINLNVAVREHEARDGHKEIVFLHKIMPGAADKSYGVHVARMAGIPAAVVRRAEQVLVELERGFQADAQSTAMRPKRVARKQLADLSLFPEQT